MVIGLHKIYLQSLRILNSGNDELPAKQAI